MKILQKLTFILSLIFPVSAVVSAELPSSERSQNAINRVKGKLEQQLTSVGLEFGSPIYIRIFKQTDELELWVKKEDKYQLFKTYDICTFSGDLGPKTKEGDKQSPEGFYFVKAGSLNPWSSYHLSFNLGYPNAYERHHGYTGSALMVHGKCVSIGCYAMTDAYMDEIYTMAHAALEQGQDYFGVHAFPFRMNDETMDKYKSHQWYSFWENLKEGYDLFEKNHIPPNVEVVDGRYVFD